MSAAAIDQFNELPQTKGPKLRRFKDGHHGKIEYLEQLGISDDGEGLPNGDHGYVFKVRIDGELYALKIFRFFDLADVLFMIGPRARSRVPHADVEAQTDPFYAECRAYRRIASRPRKKPIAVACHGFVSIPATRESFLARKFNVTGWNRPEEELSLPPAKRQPFRALVKDLVETEPEITETLVASMRRELRALNSLKIYVMDLKWDNYKGGHLVDLSAAWTEPHFEFRRDVNPGKHINMLKKADMAAFDAMVEEELGMDVAVRTQPNPDFISRLRSRRGMED